jgi:hypothetical protein
MKGRVVGTSAFVDSSGVSMSDKLQLGQLRTDEGNKSGKILKKESRNCEQIKKGYSYGLVMRRSINVPCTQEIQL